MAISNPNRDVLLTLAKAGVIDLIGKEWYFVRVHDAVQVCLQRVQSLTDNSKTSESSLTEEKSSYLKRLLKERLDEPSNIDLESGHRQQPFFNRDLDPQLEPLLSRKS